MDSVIVFPDKAEFTDDGETEKKGIGIGQVSWICAAERGSWSWSGMVKLNQNRILCIQDKSEFT